MAFDANGVFDAIVSAAEKLGVFERVRKHEPKSPPGAGLSLALWWGGPAEAYAGGSGLAAASVRFEIHGRIYMALLAKDEDRIDPAVLSAAVNLFAALTSQFTLGGLVRNVSILGEGGSLMSGQPAYIQHDDKHYRVADLVIPVIINDLWAEAA